MKGFAHIGVMKALEERGITPTLYAGTSIGAMLAAARVGGMSPDDLARRAETLRRRDLFRLNHFGMLMERMRSPSIYLEDPLRDLTRAVVPPGKFSDLPTPLLVNTVDLERGAPVIWGSPGLQDVYVQDAVYASCALPGYFPPGRVGDRLCVDGGVIDNLPVAIAVARRRSHHRRRRRQHRSHADQRRDVAGLREHLHARGDDDDARAAAVSAHALERPADGADPSAVRRGLAQLRQYLGHDQRRTSRRRTRRSKTSTRITISRVACIPAAASSSTSTATSASVAACASRSRRASWGSTRRAKRTRDREPSTGRQPTAISCTTARPARSPRERSSGSCL